MDRRVTARPCAAPRPLLPSSAMVETPAAKTARLVNMKSAPDRLKFETICEIPFAAERYFEFIIIVRG